MFARCRGDSGSFHLLFMLRAYSVQEFEYSQAYEGDQTDAKRKTVTTAPAHDWRGGRF